MAIFAVDVGGTRIKLGLVEDGKVLTRSSIAAWSDQGLAAALPRIASALRDLTREPVDGLGMAFPSLVEGDRIVGSVGKYRDAEEIDLASWARDEFQVPFAVDNDARMATIGEWQYGAGRGLTDMVMVTLGTGIGTGVISGGQVLRGRHGAAGILGGHMTARVGGWPCPCGNQGCWETEASTAWLSALGTDYPDYAAVFSSESAEARQIRERSLEIWGALAVSLIHAYDPQVLVLGGGVMTSGDAILGPVQEIVRRNAWTPWGSPRVVASSLGNNAALVACEWLLNEIR